MIPRLFDVGTKALHYGRYAQLLPRGFSVACLTWEWWSEYKKSQTHVDEELARIIESFTDRKIKPNDIQVYPYLFASIYVLSGALLVIKDIPAERFKKILEMTEQLIIESCKIFKRYPTKMATRDTLQHPLVKILHQIDGPTNCFPSLHVSLSILMKEITEHHSTMDPLMKQAFRQSCIDICRSTVELKQHSIVDVLGGQEIAHRMLAKYLEIDGCEDLSHAILPEVNEYTLQELRKSVSESDDMVDAIPYMLDILNRPD